MSYATRAKESRISRDAKSGDLSIENAVIFWTNFKGAKTTFNAKGGKRTFNIALPEDLAMELKDEGWNIKRREPYDDQDDPLYFTEIVLNMEFYIEPKVMLCSEWNGKKSMNRLHDSMVGKLDNMRFDNVDVVIHPRKHDTGYKGYCNELFATQAKDDLFGGKYNDYELNDDMNNAVSDEEPF